MFTEERDLKSCFVDGPLAFDFLIVGCPYQV